MILKNMPDYELINSKTDSFSNKTLMCVALRLSFHMKGYDYKSNK